MFLQLLLINMHNCFANLTILNHRYVLHEIFSILINC
jgi:hypothetical protein